MGGKHVSRLCTCTQKVLAPYFTFHLLPSPDNFHFKAVTFLVSLWKKNALVTDYSPQLTLSLCMTTEEQALTLQHTLTVLGTKTALVSIWTLLILCHWAPCLIPWASSETANAG